MWEVKLNIGVDKPEPYENLFQVCYTVEMHEDFIRKKEEKKHNIKNHAQRMKDKIKLNHLPEELSELKKWKICFVNFGMNIGTEINGVRPAIIYKHNPYRYGEDIIVIPITSYENDSTTVKSQDTFDVEIEASEENGLSHRSLIKTRQIRCISKKRIRKDKKTHDIIILGKIAEEELRKLIDTKVRTMFWI